MKTALKLAACWAVLRVSLGTAGIVISALGLRVNTPTDHTPAGLRVLATAAAALLLVAGNANCSAPFCSAEGEGGEPCCGRWDDDSRFACFEIGQSMRGCCGRRTGPLGRKR
jgi:hypothetical protein